MLITLLWWGGLVLYFFFFFFLILHNTTLPSLIQHITTHLTLGNMTGVWQHPTKPNRDGGISTWMDGWMDGNAQVVATKRLTQTTIPYPALTFAT